MHRECRIIKIIEQSVHSGCLIISKHFLAEYAGENPRKELEEAALVIGPAKLQADNKSKGAAD